MARAPGRSYAMMVTGFVLRLLFSLLIIFVCLLLGWRVFISNRLPSDFKRISPNPTLSTAYREKGGALTLFTQGQATTTKAESNYGYFSIPRFVFIEEANQVQVVFRYNNSTLEAVQRDLALAEEPPRGVEVFDVTLVTVTDLTPEDDSDNVDGSSTLQKTRTAPTGEPMIETTLLYTYFLYTFDNVSTADGVLAVFMDIYYGDAPDYATEALGTLRLYHYQSTRTPVELSGKEARAIEAFNSFD